MIRRDELAQLMAGIEAKTAKAAINEIVDLSARVFESEAGAFFRTDGSAQAYAEVARGVYPRYIPEMENTELPARFLVSGHDARPRHLSRIAFLDRRPDMSRA